MWILYLAIEPYARRNWPDMLISWSRLLGGRLKDPLVGRDLLVGAAGAALTDGLRDLIVRLWPGPPPAPAPILPFYSASARDAIGLGFALPVSDIVSVLGLVFFLVLGRRWLRREWIAAVVVTVLFSLIYIGVDTAYLVAQVVCVALLVFIAIRFGVLAALVSSVLSDALYFFVRTAELSAWYFATGPIAAAVVLAVAIWGYRRAVAVRAVALAEA